MKFVFYTYGLLVKGKGLVQLDCCDLLNGLTISLGQVWGRGTEVEQEKSHDRGPRK